MGGKKGRVKSVKILWWVEGEGNGGERGRIMGWKRGELRLGKGGGLLWVEGRVTGGKNWRFMGGKRGRVKAGKRGRVTGEEGLWVGKGEA